MSGAHGVATAPAPSASVWLSTLRPRTLPAGAAPVIVGTALAWSAGAVHAGAALLALVGALLLQITSNLANDLFDAEKGADGPDRLGPVRATAAGLVTAGAMRRAVLVALGACVLAGLGLVLRGGLPVVVIGVSSMAAAILYTGGPRPLAYLGLGEVFVFLFFGLVAVAGTFFVQALTVPSWVIAGGVAPGLLSSAILVVNNVRDRAGDARVGKRTLAVRFGERFGVAEHRALIVGGAAASVLMWPGLGAWSLLPALVVIPGLKVHAAVREAVGRGELRALNPLLGGTAKLLVIHAVLVVAAVALKAAVGAMP
jgi:1,4-dihydroxy-2-naphthoate octaprenyltransferase